jgi:hypothetical protein
MHLTLDILLSPIDKGLFGPAGGFKTLKLKL